MNESKRITTRHHLRPVFGELRPYPRRQAAGFRRD